VLPMGSHTVSWEVKDAAGNVYATLNQTVAVVHDVGPQCCDPEQILTEGSAANDVAVLGGPSASCVLGDAGDDFVATGSGADWVWGGPGGDYIAGGGGDDVLSGGDGDDYLTGGKGGALTVYAGPGDDTVHARFAASARIFGGGGADVLIGSDGPDEIYPGPGTILVLGGNGDDTVTIYDACELSPGMRLDGGAGNDRLVSPVPREQLISAGVRVERFETIVVDATRAYLSECFQ
jgi:Ca2+-binding RTX toxin-like protein